MREIVLKGKTALVHLELFEPKQNGEDSNRVDIESVDETTTYYKSPLAEFRLGGRYNHFPVPTDSDGRPWLHATMYLMDKLDNPCQPNSKTLVCISDDLLLFKSCVEEFGIDYLKSYKRKLKRPTYAYRAYLQEQIECGSIAKSTASRRMSSVVGFYRWLQTKIEFEYPVWTESEKLIRFNDSYGSVQMKTVKSTDLRVKIPRSRDDYSEYINDGGQLKALDRDQQIKLLSTLLSMGNPEMLLAFLIALTTGARMQTVFTLRLKHLDVNMDSSKRVLAIIVGHGTGVDTKYQKRMVIYIPRWLHLRIKIYLKSERAMNRRRRSRHYSDVRDEQYLFLTQVGAPYYIAEQDPKVSDYRYPARGGAVRQFVAYQLRPLLVEKDQLFSFKFHDLRATFGMNLLEDKLGSLEEGRDKLFDVLMYIKERMGHSNLTTTQGYLDFKSKSKIAGYAQSEFEQYLESLVADSLDEQ